MAKQDNSSSRSRKPQNTITGLILVILLAIAFGVYYFKGYDPLHLFTPKPTPTPIVTPTAQPHTIATPTPGAAPTVVIPIQGDWWQVYFTDPWHLSASKDPNIVTAGSIEEKLIARIQAAKRSIHIAAYELDRNPLAQALIAAHQRGVEVLFVTDNEDGLGKDQQKGRGQFKLLQDAGIPVKTDDRSALMHNKILIFDGATVWTGATNLTKAGIYENNNNAIVFQSPELATVFEREFQELWSGQFGPKAPSTVDQQKVIINGTSIQVLFSPEDKVINYLIPIVQQAQSSIRAMAFSFTQSDMGAAMIARAKAGVNVGGVWENTGSEMPSSELLPLYCAGIPVRQDGNPSTMHHKVIVVDARWVVTGSFNFSDNAASNNENALIIDNANIAALYLQEFERVWTQAEGHDPDPAKMGCPNVLPTALRPIVGQPVAVQATPAQTESTPGQPAQATPVPATATECTIKGNIDGSGNKFYYLPNDTGYSRVKIDTAQGEKMFCSEMEAQQAGWTHKTN